MLDVIRTAYDEFAEHDAARCPREAGFASRVGRGRRGLADWHIHRAGRRRERCLRRDRGELRRVSVDPSEYIDQGSRVVVKGRFIGKNKSGVELDTGFEHVFDMRDGKVVRFENKRRRRGVDRRGRTS